MFACEKQTVQVKGYQYAGTVRKQTALSCLTTICRNSEKADSSVMSYNNMQEQ